MMKKPIAIFILIAFCAGAQAAEDSGFYAGASLGASEFSNRGELCDGPSYIFGSPLARPNQDSDCDDEKIGWKIFGGYSFGGIFALEGGFAQLGQVGANLNFLRNTNCLGFRRSNDSIDTRCSIDGYRSNLTYKHNGSLFAFALARYPFTERFSVFGKLGAHFYSIDVGGNVTEIGCLPRRAETIRDDPPEDPPIQIPAASDCTPQLPLTNDFDEDGAEVAYGVGLEYRFNDNIGVRAEWERFEFDGRFFSDSADFYSAAIVYHF